MSRKNHSTGIPSHPSHTISPFHSYFRHGISFHFKFSVDTIKNRGNCKLSVTIFNLNKLEDDEDYDDDGDYNDDDGYDDDEDYNKYV